MKPVPFVCVSLLLTSVLFLQGTSQHKHVVYIPAMNGPVKVRPAFLPDPIPPVVSLIEADRRSFKEKALPAPSPWDEPLPYKDHGLILETNNQSHESFSRPKLERLIGYIRHKPASPRLEGL